MQDPNNTAHIPASAGDDDDLNSRVFRTMVITAAIAGAVSGFIAPWRVTSGLIMGGVLALFSHSWLKNSAAAAIRLSIGGTPQLRLAQFLLRYVVIAAVVFAAYTLNLISLVAVLAGLCTFVVAVLVEGLREFYFAIKHREEIS